MHGQPDWGMYGIAETIYRLADMGELAARLESVVTFDRRGNVVFADSFEYGLGAWDTVLVGTGAAAAVDDTVCRMKKYSLKLTTGNAIGNTAQAYTSRAIAVIGSLGLEVSFTGPGTDERWSFSFWFYDGVNRHEASVRVDGDDETVTIWITAGATYTFEMSYPLYIGTRQFHTLKLVADFENDLWQRIIIDKESWSLTDKGLYVPASGTRPILYVGATLTTLANANKSRHLDDVIITQNEP